jgi:hypothetical protein
MTLCVFYPPSGAGTRPLLLTADEDSQYDKGVNLSGKLPIGSREVPNHQQTAIGEGIQSMGNFHVLWKKCWTR